MKIDLRESTELRRPFEWIDARRRKISVAEMETRHVFFSLRMIWNHAMPEDAKKCLAHMETYCLEQH